MLDGLSDPLDHAVQRLPVAALTITVMLVVVIFGFWVWSREQRLKLRAQAALLAAQPRTCDGGPPASPGTDEHTLRCRLARRLLGVNGEGNHP